MPPTYEAAQGVVARVDELGDAPVGSRDDHRICTFDSALLKPSLDSFFEDGADDPTLARERLGPQLHAMGRILDGVAERASVGPTPADVHHGCVLELADSGGPARPAPWL